MKSIQLRNILFWGIYFVSLVSAVTNCVAGTAGEWDIERVVQTALKNSEAVIRAGEELRKKELALQMTQAVNQSALTVDIERTRVKNPLTGEYEITGDEKIILKIPLAPKLVVESSLNIGEPAFVRLDYYPLAENVEEARAQLDFSVQQLEYQKTLVYTELEARKQFIALLAACKSRRQAEENLVLTEWALEITERRFRTGLSGRAELDRAEAEVLEARVKLAAAKIDEYETRQSLARLLKTDLSRAEFVELSAFPQKHTTDEKMLKNAEENDVELKKARLLLLFARENLDRVKKNKPVIFIGAGTNTENWEAVLSAGFTLTLGASYPRRVEEAKISVQQQERAVEAAVEAVEDSLTAAIRDFELQRLKMEVLEHKKSLAVRDYCDAQRQYENGEILLVDLEKARLAAQTAQEDYITGWNNLWQIWYILLAIIAV